jgi:hypothetical protein
VVNGAELTISARPSDAVALALRVGAPILVNDELMDAEAQIFEPDDDDDESFGVVAMEVEEEDLVAELHEFLDGFGKGEGAS